jgi:hypothetical protein
VKNHKLRDEKFDEYWHTWKGTSEEDNEWLYANLYSSWCHSWDRREETLLAELRVVRLDIQRRMNSDEKCDHPFDEDLAGSLAILDKILDEEHPQKYPQIPNKDKEPGDNIITANRNDLEKAVQCLTTMSGHNIPRAVGILEKILGEKE